MSLPLRRSHNAMAAYQSANARLQVVYRPIAALKLVQEIRVSTAGGRFDKSPIASRQEIDWRIGNLNEGHGRVDRKRSVSPIGKPVSMGVDAPSIASKVRKMSDHN